MKKNLIFLTSIIVLLAFGAILYSQNYWVAKEKKSPSTEEPVLTKVKVGYMPFTSNWIMFLALENNMFKDEEIDAEPVSFTSGTDAANALAQGDIAVHAINTYTDLLNMEARNPGTFKLVIVQQSSEQNSNEALVVKADSPINKASQLTGKKIGVTPGIFSEAMIKKAYDNDIDFQKKTLIVKLPPQTQLESLENGQIDALLAFEPAITIGLEKGSIKILDDHPWGKVQEPFPIGGYTLSTKFINENPELSKKISNVLIKALDYGLQNPEEVYKAIAKFTNQDESTVSKLRQNDNIPVLELPTNYFQETANLYYKLGQVDSLVNTDNFGYGK